MLPCPGAFRAVGAAITCSLRRAPGRKKRQKEVGPSGALGSRRERDSRRPLARARFHDTAGVDPEGNETPSGSTRLYT